MIDKVVRNDASYNGILDVDRKWVWHSGIWTLQTCLQNFLLGTEASSDNGNGCLMTKNVKKTRFMSCFDCCVNTWKVGRRHVKWIALEIKSYSVGRCSTVD